MRRNFFVAVMIFAALLMANSILLLPRSQKAMLMLLDARTDLRAEQPEPALAKMNGAAQLYPFNPDHRRNMLVPVAMIAAKGKVLPLETAATAFQVSVHAGGYEQNTLNLWLMWLALAGYGDSEAYRTARERLMQVNPRLAEPYETDAFIAGNKNNLSDAMHAAQMMRDLAISDNVRARAIEIIGVIENAPGS